jgi:hypothetical protein
MDGYHHSLIYFNIVLMDRYSALIMMVIVVREVSSNNSPLLPIIPNQMSRPAWRCANNSQ